EIAEQRGDRRLAGEPRRFLPVLLDAREIDVRDEVIGVGAREHEHLEPVVCLGLRDQRDEVSDELRAEEIHGRRRDLDEQHGLLALVLGRSERHGPRKAWPAAATWAGYWKRKPWPASL